jgi:hypothetical protein
VNAYSKKIVNVYDHERITTEHATPTSIWIAPSLIQVDLENEKLDHVIRNRILSIRPYLNVTAFTPTLREKIKETFKPIPGVESIPISALLRSNLWLRA